MCCKKALTAFVAMLLLSNVAAAREIGAGTTEIGGNFGLAMSSTSVDADGDKFDVDTTAVSLFALRYIVPDLGVGISWNYNAEEYTAGSSWFDQSSYAIGPVIAFNVSLAPQASVKFVGKYGLISSTSQDSEGYERDGDGTLWSGGAQLSYFLTDNASINAIVDYTSQSIDYTERLINFDDYNYTVDTTGFQYGLGLSIYLQ